MKTWLTIVLMALTTMLSAAQSYRTERSNVRFFSSAPLEDISATNKDAIGVFNAATGDIAFVIPITGFQFAKSLMQEHFNENFMESERFPRGTFEGKLMGFKMDKSGTQSVNAKGKMTIHGVEKQMEMNGKFTVDKGRIIMESVFPIKLEDHDVEIPKLLFQKIAEEVEVTVHFEFIEN